MWRLKAKSPSRQQEALASSMGVTVAPFLPNPGTQGEGKTSVNSIPREEIFVLENKRWPLACSRHSQLRVCVEALPMKAVLR